MLLSIYIRREDDEMHGQLAIAALLISLTVVIHAIGFEGLIRFLRHAATHWIPSRRTPISVCLVIGMILAIIALHIIEMWIWSVCYYYLGEFERFDAALYFSIVTYTTLGYGDITLSNHWRLLGSLEAVNGILLFGWSTAFIFNVLSHVWRLTGVIPDSESPPQSASQRSSSAE